MLRALALILALPAAVAVPAGARAEGPIELSVVGGLDGLRQYTRLERPFWTEELRERSGGRLAATIKPFDRSGLRGQEMLQLIRLGVVPFGTAQLALVSADEPELNGIDLPALNPDLPTLRATVATYRPRVADILKSRYGIELLGIYVYQAQVLFCTRPLSGLADVAGRRVRTSSVSQSELMLALGARPVVFPFNEVAAALRKDLVDCAITGTLSGHEIGLPAVTSHMHAMAISWGLSFFGANEAAWAALPDEARAVIRSGVGALEARIWEAAEHDTGMGLACDTGSPGCPEPRPGRLALVPVSAADEATRKRLFVEAVLPAWFRRCGSGCVEAWNATMAETTGLRAVTGGPDQGGTIPRVEPSAGAAASPVGVARP